MTNKRGYIKKKKIPFSVSLFFDDFIVLRLTMEFLILLRCCIKWEREIMRVNKYSLASSPNVWNFLTIKEHDLPENDPKNATGLRFPLYVSYDLDVKYKSVERALVMHRASFWCVVWISSKARQNANFVVQISTSSCHGIFGRVHRCKNYRK